MNEIRKLPHAEDVGHYWKTGTSASDVWIERAKNLIKEINGTIDSEAFGNANGRAAYMIRFTLHGQPYRIVWPVLPTYKGEEKAARIQAATMLYHDIKAKVMAASVLGDKVAFFSYMELPDGHIAGELQSSALSGYFPPLLKENNL